jgi:KUP system potassium uptake protein
MSLLGIEKHQRPAIIAVGLFGAALIYGDGAITPALIRDGSLSAGL